jgi:hypothetical protein
VVVVARVLFSVSIVVLPLFACQATDPPAAALSRQVRALAEETAPSGGAMTIVPGHAPGGAAEATWIVQTPMSWKDYTFWLERRLHGRYRTIAAEHDALVFSRPLSGDLYTLRASVTSHGPPLRVRFEFQAIAY